MSRQVEGDAAAVTSGRAAALAAGADFATTLGDIAKAEKAAGKDVPMDDLQLALLHMSAGAFGRPLFLPRIGSPQ